MNLKTLVEPHIIERQSKILGKIKTFPEGGVNITYLNFELLVQRNVFTPCEDSWQLVKQINPKSTDLILDVGTGCGNIAIGLAKKGTQKVIAVDWNDAAINNSQLNVKKHNLENIVVPEISNLFSTVQDQKFDIIVANLPFMNYPANDTVDSAIWDTELISNKFFLKNYRDYLKTNGRVFIAQSNFGALEELKEFGSELNIEFRLIGEQKSLTDPESIFYTFQLISL